MYSKQRLFVSAALILTSLLGVSTVNAQNQPLCYSLGSLQGSYAIVASYSDHAAMALSTRSLDASGKMTGTFLINGPTAGSTTGERTIVTGTQVGSVTVNCNGTGVITRVLTLAAGGTVNVVDDFIITGAIVRNGQLVVTSLQDVQQTSSTIVAGGLFVFRTWTRLPDYTDVLTSQIPR
jgi:hypothetical protein